MISRFLNQKKSFLKRSFWKKGAGEMVGFLATLPFLLFIMLMIVSVIQAGTLRERLEYEAYRLARTAVVCKDEKTARKTVKKQVKEDFKGANLKIVKGSESADVELADGEESKKASNEGKWVKGNFVTVTVKAEIKPIYLNFGTRIKSAKMTMMIETPVYEDGGDYPWSEDMK